MSNRILVVEDEPAILRGLQDNLRMESFDVLTASDGESGYRMALEAKPDLIILDLMLPKMSGYEICRKLRGDGVNTPILILTARGEETDRVLGLDLGADDYVTKPFSIRELLARVRALLRRAQPAAAEPMMTLRFSGAILDFQKYEATKDGKPVDLTRKEFGIVRFLASRPGVVVSRDELLNEVWGYDAYPSTRTVDNHIASLRAKLEPDPANPKHFLTVHGVGYKFQQS
ncbi:DNA-binding response regulator [Bryobacterales bacterium F-183]|nr:DNA-binding response regulator [Bryobacterales bacterium F-183]